jgi:hypothetical protein
MGDGAPDCAGGWEARVVEEVKVNAGTWMALEKVKPLEDLTFLYRSKSSGVIILRISDLWPDGRESASERVRARERER